MLFRVCLIQHLVQNSFVTLLHHTPKSQQQQIKYLQTFKIKKDIQFTLRLKGIEEGFQYMMDISKNIEEKCVVSRYIWATLLKFVELSQVHKFMDE